jgi:hypothetical protein
MGLMAREPKQSPLTSQVEIGEVLGQVARVGKQEAAELFRFPEGFWTDFCLCCSSFVVEARVGFSI